MNQIKVIEKWRRCHIPDQRACSERLFGGNVKAFQIKYLAVFRFSTYFIERVLLENFCDETRLNANFEPILFAITEKQRR